MNRFYTLHDGKFGHEEKSRNGASQIYPFFAMWSVLGLQGFRCTVSVMNNLESLHTAFQSFIFILEASFLNPGFHMTSASRRLGRVIWELDFPCRRLMKFFMLISQVRNEYKNAYIRWKTGDKHYGKKKPRVVSCHCCWKASSCPR